MPDGDAPTREEFKALERDVSFLARFIRLSEAGHATVREHGRASEIADRYDRLTDEPREK